MKLEEFVSKLNNFASWEDKKKIDFLAFFHTFKDSSHVFTATDIEQSLAVLDIRPYSRTAAYLSEEAKSKTGKYLKQKKGYRLERKKFDEIKRQIENEPKMFEVSQQLVDLIPKVTDTQEQSFLIEAINCYKVEAYRAAIVMVWTLTIDHLQKYVFGNKLTEFNDSISRDSDKKLQHVIQYDDFSGFKEVKLIELMRSSNSISNDVRKILDEKLGIRNSAGHPSGIIVLGHKATEFIGDLIVNVLLKY